MITEKCEICGESLKEVTCMRCNKKICGNHITTETDLEKSGFYYCVLCGETYKQNKEFFEKLLLRDGFDLEPIL